jgi:hypothetical protein
MNKKSVILFGVGIVVGYLFIKLRNNKSIVSSSEKGFPNISSQTEPPKTLGGETAELEESEPTKEIIDPRIEPCKEKWLKFSSTVKFTSQEQMQSTYNNYMTTCVAQS